MNIPTEIFILASGMIGASIGFLGSALCYSRARRRIQQDTWAAANRYYSRRYQLPESRI